MVFVLTFYPLFFSIIGEGIKTKGGNSNENSTDFIKLN